MVVDARLHGVNVAAETWSVHALAECGDGRDASCRHSQVQDQHSGVHQCATARS